MDELTLDDFHRIMDHFIFELSVAAGMRDPMEVFDTTLGEVLDCVVAQLNDYNAAENA